MTLKNHHNCKDLLSQTTVGSNLIWHDKHLWNLPFKYSAIHSRCPSQIWHFQQHDKKDVRSVAFQVLVTMVGTSSVIFTLIIIFHFSHIINNNTSDFLGVKFQIWSSSCPSLFLGVVLIFLLLLTPEIEIQC